MLFNAYNSCEIPIAFNFRFFRCMLLKSHKCNLIKSMILNFGLL